MNRGMDDRWRTAVGALVALALCGMADGALAGGRGRPRVVRSAGLTVTGFAVPVGIPVAGAPWPLVVYSYRGVAGEPNSRVAGGAGCGCATCVYQGSGGPRAAGEEAANVAEPAAAEPRGAAVLREKCARCHSGETAEGKVDLWKSATGAWREGWRQASGAIYRAVRDGRMPKGGPPLSDEEFAAVVDYLLNTDTQDETESASAVAE